ncbi:hypothetical protein PR048_028985 [Dryococelus australis]|uniref:Uncharacterized protein n=1 Tax=Dryococelus australis TaxID=614101 RepID=A0ABQ9GC35_9NEOP|nr:hypothetical protein PR048_028985 [Dryococelus australis]
MCKITSVLGPMWDPVVDVLSCQYVDFVKQRFPNNCQAVSLKSSWYLQTFCDASRLPYTAMVFLRSFDGQEVKVQLVVAKSKNITIPWLELPACKIGSRLAISFIESSGLTDIPTFDWCETCVGFVCCQQGEGNSILGLFRKLVSCGMSLHGLPASAIPADKEEVDRERRKCTTALMISHKEQPWDLHYFSKYSKFVSMVRWILRLQNLEHFQRSNRTFKCEDKDNQKKKPRRFPFTYSFTIKSPFDRGGICESITCPCTDFAFFLREDFWIPKGRRTLRKVLGRCFQCKRFEAKKPTTMHPAFPEDRMRYTAVFEIVGVDLAGPLNLKGGIKAWVVIFTCTLFRVVHFELVLALSIA